MTRTAKSPAFPQTWMIIVILGVVIAALVAGYFLLIRREMAVLFQDLRPTEASVIVAELEAQGIPYELRDSGGTILTSTDQLDEVRLKIAAAELPVQGLDGFELFDNSDLGLTEFAQRIKYQRAIQGELARTIMRIEGIDEARVHISIPERSVFRGEKAPAKAAVSLTTRSKDIETIETIEGIQQLVSAAIPDLSASDVAVINGRGEIISRKIEALALDATAPGLTPQSGTVALTTALRAAFPGTSIDVDLIDAPAPIGVDGVVLDGAGELSSRPKAIRIRTETALDVKGQERAAAAVKSVVSADIPADLQLVFEIAPHSLPPPGAIAPVAGATSSLPTQPPSPPKSESGPSNEDDRGLSDQNVLLLSLAIGAIAVMILILLVLRRSRPLLSFEEQKLFAERLKLGLQSQAQEQLDAPR
jgi:flagellar M-ring protein FliF